MMKYIFCAMVLCSFLACKKNGTGGKATIAAIPQHHGKSIKGGVLYVKFGASELPSNPTTNYDLKLQGEAKEDHIHVEDLRYGQYYLYVEGYDSTVMKTVHGGVGVKIKWSERKEERDVVVPVTE
jgi:hypothetical protein